MSADTDHRFPAGLQHAMAALNRGDKDALLREIESMTADSPRDVVLALVRLARELSLAMGELPVNDPSMAELPDASARLNHVVEVTEKSTHKTLDLIDQCRQVVDSLPMSELSLESLESVSDLRRHLADMAMEQAYQDLTGQTIRRVARLVQRVSEALSLLGLATEPYDPSKDEAGGPVVPGVDRHGVSQSDADDLLSELGI
ncbi:MAG TPA: protein phosphatase CheZ [Arenimonas sp.]|nr:protein phosphatase CheZ [Arenimonas sp.]